ncbi:FAD-dependent oxidoreductase [Candidatus Wolfebacteria bacterium]|nr:FAD-dependent oxidoreductase [Candidatus Wolfebacteria bacterium]
MTYDLIIIGGGPAGMAAGIYAARKKIKTLLIAENLGGQFVIAAKIENFIGFKAISGVELKNRMEEHLRSQEGVDIKEGRKIVKIEKKDGGFSVKTDKEEVFETKTVLVALGSGPRRLNISGEEKFGGKGVFYCSICDAPLMKNRTAVVVGGGNSGMYAALDLLPYAEKIYILEYSENLKGDSVYVEKIKASGKAEIITMAAVKEIIGDDFVSSVKYEDRRAGEVKDLPAAGVFVSIGYQPNSDIVKDLVELNGFGKIAVNSKTQTTSCEGIWAAGDITDVLYCQINIAIGDAVKAVLNIYDYLKKQA